MEQSNPKQTLAVTSNINSKRKEQRIIPISSKQPRPTIEYDILVLPVMIFIGGNYYAVITVRTHTRTRTVYQKQN